MSKTFLIGSCESFSGKSALVLGMARSLISSKHQVRFGKPLATSLELNISESGDTKEMIDDDVRFVGETLKLSLDNLIPSIQFLSSSTASERIQNIDLQSGKKFNQLKSTLNSSNGYINILEAAGSLHEGLLYGLSLSQLAKGLNAKVILAHFWQDSRSIEALLEAKNQLGNHLSGIILNAVNPDQISDIKEKIVPSLKLLGLDVFGVMPRSPLLRSVTVEELVRRLNARVICCPERLELMVETLSIGAMSVNSAMEFFRRRRNMAVVTGADRTDIQLAALEASTQCLILTGAGEPLPQLINRSEELEVPLLKVDRDTLSTVEVIEQAFGHVRLHETVKATYAFRLVQEHCDLDRIFKTLGISSSVD